MSIPYMLGYITSSHKESKSQRNGQSTSQEKKFQSFRPHQDVVFSNYLALQVMNLTIRPNVIHCSLVHIKTNPSRTRVSFEKSARIQPAAHRRDLPHRSRHSPFLFSNYVWSSKSEYYILRSISFYWYPNHSNSTSQLHFKFIYLKRSDLNY